MKLPIGIVMGQSISWKNLIRIYAASGKILGDFYASPGLPFVNHGTARRPSDARIIREISISCRAPVAPRGPIRVRTQRTTRRSGSFTKGNHKGRVEPRLAFIQSGRRRVLAFHGFWCRPKLRMDDRWRPACNGRVSICAARKWELKSNRTCPLGLVRAVDLAFLRRVLFAGHLISYAGPRNARRNTSAVPAHVTGVVALTQPSRNAFRMRVAPRPRRDEAL